MRCVSCGAKLDPDEEFCLACGNINAMHPKGGTGPMIQSEPSLHWVLYILAVIVALLFVAANYHPVMARLFSPGPVLIASNVEEGICGQLALGGSSMDCTSTGGCDQACTDPIQGICAIAGHKPLDSIFRDGHCTCLCQPQKN